ncbi:MAG: hypothetical protein V4471_02330 [Pseudomonadota bacterium]
MEKENKKIRLAPTSQLLLKPNVLKRTVTSENFQISLGDGVPKNSFDPSEVMNELARVHLAAMEWKIIEEGKLCELKIKVPELCAGKIKEIGLYYSERPQDNGTLIAYWYQAQARLGREKEELVFQLVVPYKDNQTENTNNLEHSMSTQGTADLDRTVQAAETASKQCIVRNSDDICLLALPEEMGSHNNYYGNYNIKVIDTNDARTVVLVTSLYYTNSIPVKFIIPKGYNLVPNRWWWTYWTVDKDLHSEKQEKLNDTNKKLENEKDQKIKELQKQLDDEKDQKIKELEDKIQKVKNDPISDQRERKRDIHSKVKEEIAELEKRLEKLQDEAKEDETKEVDKKIKELNDAITAIKTKKDNDIKKINDEKSEDRIGELKEKIDELVEKLNDEKNEKSKQLEEKLNDEKQKKIQELGDKLTKAIKEKLKENDNAEKETGEPNKINEVGSHQFCNCVVINCCCC